MPPSWPWTTGFDHQFSGSVCTVFSSTMEPTLSDSVQAVMHQPQGFDTVIFTVVASGAVSPLICRLGSLAASLSSIVLWKEVRPAGFFFADGAAPAAAWTLSKPAIALRLEA